MANTNFRKRKIELFRSMSFYEEWEKEAERQGISKKAFFIAITEATKLIHEAFDIEKSIKGKVFWEIRNEVWNQLVSVIRESKKVNYKVSMNQKAEDKRAEPVLEKMKKGYHESKAKLYNSPSAGRGGFGYGKIDRDPYFT